MNKRFIIINFAAFAVMLFLSTGCKQDGKQDAVPSYRVITVSSMPVEISESYSATIRGRQDVDIMPQISGRITRLCVKEGTRVTTGQVLAVIDQTPYLAALRTALANVSAARAKAETARIELQGKQALFDEKVISEYDLSLARNQLAVALAELQDKIIAYRLKNGRAEAAYLTVDRLNDGNRFIVKEGLSVGDTLIAEGVGLVREGMSITPKDETK